MDLMKFFRNDKIETKAGIVQSAEQIINPFQIINGTSYQQNLNPLNLIKFNSGWVSTCNDKNARTLASIPLKLYYKNVTSNELKLTSHKRLDNKQSSKICKAIGMTKEIEIDEITEHPILQLFEKINPVLNYYDFTEIVQSYEGLIGNAYVQIIKNKEGMPTELIPLLSEYVRPVAETINSGKILYYLYKPANVEYKFSTDEIIHFAQYTAGNLLIGKGDLEKCFSAQERMCYYDNFEKFLGVNNSRPDFAVNYKNRLAENDLRDIYRQWNKRFGGVQNSGKVVVTSGDMEIKNLSMSPKELQYEVGRKWSQKEICSAFGVPIALVDTENVNYANAASATNFYLRYTIYPKMAKYCSKFNESFVKTYDPNLFVWFPEEYLEDPVQKTASIISMYNAGIISNEEARSGLGYEGSIEIEDEEVEVEDTEDKPIEE